MDKEKILSMLKDADLFARDIEKGFPKARNIVNSLTWKLRKIREEIISPDMAVAAPEPSDGQLTPT